MAKDDSGPLQSYPWYFNDWLASETRLTMTAEERGIYRDLLDLCWAEGSLPKDVQLLRRMASADPDEWKRAWPKISAKFEERDGRLYNSKVDAKRPQTLHNKDARSASASKAARARWGASRNAGAMLDGCATQCVSNAKTCGSPSPSPSQPSTDTTNTVVSVPPQTPRCGAVAASRTDVDAEQWREYLAVFGSCGKGCNEQDQAKALRLWISAEQPERDLALADAKRRAMSDWRTPDLTAMPANHLRDKPWTRTAGPRLLPEARSPSAVMSAGERRQQEQSRLVREMCERKGIKIA